MSPDLLALGLAVLWGAVSLPLVWLNPLRYDEVATKVLVYAAAPFIFFSVIFVISVVVGMRGRSQTREKAINKIQKADGALRSFIVSSGPAWANKQTYALSLLTGATDALEGGDHKKAEILAQRLITMVEIHSSGKENAPTRFSESGRVEAMI
jgi:hypothetical protein